MNCAISTDWFKRQWILGAPKFRIIHVPAYPFMPTPNTSLLARLAEAHDAFSVHDQPKRLYLGETEHAEAKAIARAFCFVKATQPLDRLHWNGLPVFAVDAKSHIGFGSDGPSPCG